MRRSTLILPALAILVALILSSVFIVDERERALVLQFGQIKSIKNDPGIGFKIPLIQDVVKYDDRIQPLDTDEIEVTPSDDRRLVVDAFARWRIDNVTKFRQAVGVGGVATAEARLNSILVAQIRQVLGSDQVTSNTILSADRAALMNRILAAARIQAENLGVTIIDVRLKQTNLPTQNLAATFDRMRAERQREAEDERARGREAAQRVQAQADRTVVEIVSDANRQAEITRGEADAERNRVYAEAYGQDQEFFEFYRSLTAYQRALKAGNTTLLISPDSEFFGYLKSSGGSQRAPGAAAPASADTPAAGPAPEAPPAPAPDVPAPAPAPAQ
jgi:membrane protease subunit HflC